MPTCAIYARVSTDHQGDSVDHQISLLKAVARQYGSDWNVDDRFVYRDDGKSGTSIVHRHAMQRLLKDAERGLFSVVMFKGISRFARDVVDAVSMLRILRSLNVRVISFEESYDSSKSGDDDFIFTIHASVAEQESKKIGVRTKLGLREVAKKGQWPKGRAPYGFVIDPETKHLKPHPEQARVVQMVFDMYVNKGMGMVSIAKYLNAHNIRPNIKPHWSQVTVRLLLLNEAYIGRIVYGKRKIVKKYNPDNPSKPKTVNIINRHGEDVIVVDNAHPAIVDEFTFYAAQAIIKSRRKVRKRGDVHLLSGILKCSKCGDGMINNIRTRYLANRERKSYRYYCCTNRRKYGTTVCDGRTFPAAKIESAVLKGLRKMFNNLTLEEIRAQVMDDVRPTKMNPSDLLEHVERELEEIQRQIINANMKNTKGIIDDKTLSMILQELVSQQKELEDKRLELVAKMNDESDEEKQVDEFIRAVERFKRLDKVTEDNKTEAHLILSQIIKSIVVTDEGKPRVKLRYNVKPKNQPINQGNGLTDR